ncbi:methyltransferase domain-containing protein [Prochlorococcus sp. MIT 1307]|uniref:methyltransferase domain-containing protein n=1 Tax=Prochlorococcus sp. MIT 1307 TaxID=3096219 RepID=UPI002A758905|nr:methyltransferase domain-containing protein [Prochlorococcus sp. MIT 1307]
MSISFWVFTSLIVLLVFYLLAWGTQVRRYTSSSTVANAYDSWTNDRLLEQLWGEHVHLGYYPDLGRGIDFRLAKIDFVHHLVRWSGLDQLPPGSRVLDVGCGIGGSSRILSREYGFDVIGITISHAQVQRAKELTPKDLLCHFEVMDALDLKFDQSSFDGVWSVEAGPHMPDKQLYADEMLRVLRPGGVLAVADWNSRESVTGIRSGFERFVMSQLLNQWAHPDFATIHGFRQNLINSRFSGGFVDSEDWTKFTLPSWIDSILEGFRRPGAVLSLGPGALLKGLREIPTIVLMRWAFANGLMQFGVFRSRG